MSNLPKRKVTELVTRYKLEPTLRDFHVEGDADVSFYSWFFEAHDVLDVKFYKIETIEISASDLKEAGLQNNNRDRLIYLSRTLKLHSDSCKKVTCIVDRDFKIDPNDLENSILSCTDFHSIEIYLFNEKSLRAFFRLVLQERHASIGKVMTQFKSILNQLFAFRMANESLGWNMQWLDFSNCITIQNDSIYFSRDDFAKKYLSKNAKLPLLDDFLKVTKKIEAEFNSSVSFIRGHDFLNLLLSYVKNTKTQLPSHLKNEEFVKRALNATLKAEELIEYNQFKALLEKYKIKK